MYAGGYVNEFDVVMASNNGDIGEVRWTVWLYWVCMVLLLLISIKAQFEDRKTHLEAYQYKFHNNARFENYRSMRERITRLGGRPNDYDSATDNSHYLDNEEEQPFNRKQD